jgi:hypothetical protein
MSDRNVLEDWERDLMGEDWEDTGEVIHPRGRKTSIHSVRFNRDELQAIREAAKAAGVSTGMFIRQAVALELARRRAPLTDLSQELDDVAGRVQSISAALRAGRAG